MGAMKERAERVPSLFLPPPERESIAVNVFACFG